MYAPFFGLQQEAFAIAPDPRFLHLSTLHREALAHLLYGLQAGGGFVLLSGEIGTGKTTVCRCFLDQLPPGHHVAYLVNPRLTSLELLQSVCQEFGIDEPRGAADSLKAWTDALNQHLLQRHAAGEHCVLIVDEAQALSADLLEQLRLLTNLETAERKLLQIVLIGQPELRTLLARPELEQLAQRIVARVHLVPLDVAQTATYVQHRLTVAGLQGPLPFDARALALIHRLTGGVPRRINLLCQRALLGAYAQGQNQVQAPLLRQAAREVFGPESAGPAFSGWPATRTAVAVASLVLLGTVLAAAVWWPQLPAQGETAAARVVPRSAATAAANTSSDTLQPFADEQQAWQALAQRWSLPLDGGSALPCDSVRSHGVACYQAVADMALLQRLQRPGLLPLQAGGQVLLLALDDKTATLQGDQGRQQVPAATLQAAWTGSLQTLWRPPPGWLEAGGRANAQTSHWALQQLVALQGSSDSHRGSRDEQLRQRVFAFQLAQGLSLDGVAGPLTLMQIARASGGDEPRFEAASPMAGTPARH